MKKTTFVLGVLLSITAFAGIQKKAKTPPEAFTDKQHPLIEAKAGYFFFVDDTMRKVYNQGGWDVQLAGSYPIYKYLHIYGAVEYLEKSGYSLNGNQKTHIWELPISLGLKPVITLNKRAQWYITIGPRYFLAYVHNYSSYVPKHMNANGCGGFANTGFLLTYGKHFTLDFFGEYSYKKLHFSSNLPGTTAQSAQVGGITVGVGLGYSF